MNEYENFAVDKNSKEYAIIYGIVDVPGNLYNLLFVYGKNTQVIQLIGATRAGHLFSWREVFIDYEGTDALIFELDNERSEVVQSEMIKMAHRFVMGEKQVLFLFTFGLPSYKVINEYFDLCEYAFYVGGE